MSTLLSHRLSRAPLVWRAAFAAWLTLATVAVVWTVVLIRTFA